MNHIRPALFLALVACLLQAQPLPDRETLAGIPLDDAMVLDPAGPWWSRHYANQPSSAGVIGLDQESGFPRMTVADPGKYGIWRRSLVIPIDLPRYPVLVVAYRATGILASDRTVLELDRQHRAGLAILSNRELQADGEIHEVVLDLREDAESHRESLSSITLMPQCRGPEPAVFELLGLRFESDRQLPPAEKVAEDQITIQAIDRDGKPVAGATVTADPDWLNLARTTTTDAEGKATLAVANTPGAAHSLRLTKPGMAVTEISTEEAGRLAPTARLFPGVRYGGVVRNEAGEPVPNVSVRLACESTVSPTGWMMTALLTDAEGRWLAPVLPSTGGSLQISLTHPDYAPQTVGNLALAELGKQQAVLVLRRGDHLAVQVLGPDGKPVPGARVSWDKEGEDGIQGQGTTDADGRVTSPQAFVGRLQVAVQAEGLAPALATVDEGSGQPELTVHLGPGGVVKGQVVDVAGQPVPGVRVTADQRQRHRTLSWGATTDAAGRFVWAGAPREGEVEINLKKTGYLKLYFYRLRATDEEQTIVLPPPLVIQGTITDAETGKPVPDCSLVPGVVWLQDGVSLEESTFWQPRDKQRVTNGHYRFTEDACNARQSLALRIEAEGYLPASSGVLRIDAGEQVCDFQLHKGTPITGTVRLPDGQPAAGAKVYLVETGKTLILAAGMEPREWEGKTATTGPDGHYELPPATGDWWLVATHANGYGDLTADAWTQTPYLPLQPWARIEGTCYRGPTPRPDVPVSFYLERPPSVLRPDLSRETPRVRCSPRVHTNAEGRFVFARVVPGKGHISSGDIGTIPHTPIPEQSTHVELAPGETFRVTFGGSGRPVVGRVSLPERGGAPVAWNRLDGTLDRSVKVDPPKPERPPFVDDRSSEEARKRAQEWFESADGKVYLKTLMRHQEARKNAMANVESWHRNVPVSQDGSFRIEDVPTGYYELRISFMLADNPNVWGETVAGALMEFAVPEIPGGRSDEPLDLGELRPSAR